MPKTKEKKTRGRGKGVFSFIKIFSTIIIKMILANNDLFTY